MSKTYEEQMNELVVDLHKYGTDCEPRSDQVDLVNDLIEGGCIARSSLGESPWAEFNELGQKRARCILNR